MDVGANPKTAQSLARHSTLEMTMNVYGRARQDNRRGAVEALGEMLLAAGDGREMPSIGHENYRISTEPLLNPDRTFLDNPTLAPGVSLELAMMIAAWPRLPEAMKAGIVAMVEAVSTAVGRLL